MADVSPNTTLLPAAQRAFRPREARTKNKAVKTNAPAGGPLSAALAVAGIIGVNRDHKYAFSRQKSEKDKRIGAYT